MAGGGASRSRHISGLLLKPLLSCKPPADLFGFFLTSSTQPALPQPGPSGDVKRSVQCTRHGTAEHTGHAGSLWQGLWDGERQGCSSDVSVQAESRPRGPAALQA